MDSQQTASIPTLSIRPDHQDHRLSKDSPYVSMPILPYYLVCKKNIQQAYVPIQVWNLHYQDIELHPVSFCSMQASRFFRLFCPQMVLPHNPMRMRTRRCARANQWNHLKYWYVLFVCNSADFVRVAAVYTSKKINYAILERPNQNNQIQAYYLIKHVILYLMFD